MIEGVYKGFKMLYYVPMANGFGTVELDFSHNGERLLRMLRRQHPDYHPILNIAKIAHAAEDGFAQLVKRGEEMVETILPDFNLALRAHSTVLRYVEPELKSVEVVTKQEEARTIEVSLFEDPDERERRLFEERNRVLTAQRSLIEGIAIEESESTEYERL